MSDLVEGARRLFRKRKKQGESATRQPREKARLVAALTKRLGVLSEKMLRLKIQMHDVSLGYLQLVRSRFRKKIRPIKPNPQPVERRKLRRFAMRMKSTANRVLGRAEGAKVFKFPASRDT